jgi:hypothetical protein
MLDDFADCEDGIPSFASFPFFSSAVSGVLHAQSKLIRLDHGHSPPFCTKVFPDRDLMFYFCLESF